ncbi:SIR2 family NAD-dependent protein deacylase [Corynebacterium efficiens]|nr:SIR2 family protein [Corynebacterium efficiens]
MSAPDITSAVMEKFQSSGAMKHSTILLGAGASVTSGLPDWDTFASRLLSTSKAVSDGDMVKMLLARQDPLIVVEAAKVAAGKSWDYQLQMALYQGLDSLDSLSPSPLHLAVVAHFLENEQSTSLVTLNFDNLLEIALEREAHEKATSVTRASADVSGNVVHHLHGVITPQDVDSVVLTLTDFANLIECTNSWQIDYLTAAVAKGALIIAGTSYRDPDLRQWLHRALREKPDHHSAFVLLAREAFGVSKSGFELIQDALSSQWKAIGLEPILLQDHADAAQIIRELVHVEEEYYHSPQNRCRAIWEVHERDFHERQREYVKNLSRDAQRLKTVFQTDKIDLSLWISDGEKHLIRWASQDRTYHDQSALRMVETGHDSEWIAGQALGVDALLFKNLEARGGRRWLSVLAVPLSVTHPFLPAKWGEMVLQFRSTGTAF